MTSERVCECRSISRSRYPLETRCEQSGMRKQHKLARAESEFRNGSPIGCKHTTSEALIPNGIPLLANDCRLSAEQESSTERENEDRSKRRPTPFVRSSLEHKTRKLDPRHLPGVDLISVVFFLFPFRSNCWIHDHRRGYCSTAAPAPINGFVQGVIRQQRDNGTILF